MKSIALECLSKELRILKSLAALVNDTFTDIVRNILGCTGNVIFCGIGKSGNISEKISGTLACIGIRAFYQDCTHLGHGNTGAVRADDIIFCITAVRRIFYHNVSCSTASASGTLTGSVG